MSVIEIVSLALVGLFLLVAVLLFLVNILCLWQTVCSASR